MNPTTPTTDSPISAKAEAQARSTASRTWSTVSEHHSGNDGIGRNRQSQSGATAAQGGAVPADAERGSRGSVIIYAMLTMTVMLAIGLTLTSLFLSKLRSAAAARSATVALYGADSAVEMCLYEARTGIADPPMVLDSTATFAITRVAPGNPDISADCSVLSSDSFAFRATGRFRGTSRTLEISQ